ncbi:MAG TPA: DUF2637 domain-containing protein [Streptosporangiaceae bacterium]|nr:DUF2637 domain-containing protein [Streptosporangiaceae bacterium]
MSDRLARVLTGLAVLAVAVIAAAVSFSHIDALALAHGYTSDTARLLPLSVDGLIVASSLTLLTEARAHRDAPGLARLGLVLGIAGTLAANVAYGAHYGIVGAVVNAWPAVAFIMATEIAIGQMGRAGTAPTREPAGWTVADVAGADIPSRGDADRTVADVPDSVPGPVLDGVPVVEPVAVLDGVPVPRAADVPVAVLEPVAPGRVPTAPGRATRTMAAARKSRTPEKVFAAELEAGQVPSLRAIKDKMSCGTDRARVILAQLKQAVEAEAMADT